MIEVRELGNKQILEVLKRVNYCHLAVCDEGEPYVVPIHYAYDDGYIFIYTTEGKKSRILEQNSRVCLQVEEVHDNENWVSVIVNGKAERISDEDEFAAALQIVAEINPTLTPAVSVRWQDSWVRENIPAIYRIAIIETSGRRSVPPKRRR